MVGFIINIRIEGRSLISVNISEIDHDLLFCFSSDYDIIYIYLFIYLFIKLCQKHVIEQRIDI
jgi:hypothetical protein